MKKTIVIDEKLCEEAKNYAKKTGRTFSGLIEISLKRILKKERKRKMNYEELRARPVKQNGERSNHDFHLRLSKTEKERLIMLTKSANYATMSQFLKDQLFRPDLHFKLDLILKLLKNQEDEKNGKGED